MGGVRGGPGRSGGRSPGLGSIANGKGDIGGGGAAGNGGAKRDEDDFDPAVLNDVAGWLRTLRLHAQEDAQDFRGGSQEGGHRRPDHSSSAAAGVSWARTSTPAGLDSRRRTVKRPEIAKGKHDCYFFLV